MEIDIYCQNSLFLTTVKCLFWNLRSIPPTCNPEGALCIRRPKSINYKHKTSKKWPKILIINPPFALQLIHHNCQFGIDIFNNCKMLFFRLDCGTGPGIVRSSSRANLGRWNRLTVFRHDWGVWLQLNGGPHEEGRSQVRIYFLHGICIPGKDSSLELT